MDNPLVVVAPPEHRLAGRKRIPVSVLEQETFVMREPGSGARQALVRFCADNGLKLRQGMETTRNESIKQAVRAGLGIGVASLHTIELELETGRLVILDVDGFPIRRRCYVVYWRNKRLSPVTEVFRQFVVDEGAAI